METKIHLVDSINVHTIRKQHRVFPTETVIVYFLSKSYIESYLELDFLKIKCTFIQLKISIETLIYFRTRMMRILNKNPPMLSDITEVINKI